MQRGHVLFRILSTIENATVAYMRHPGRSTVSYYRFVREFQDLQDISDRELRAMTRYAIEKKYVRITKSTHVISLSKKGRQFLVRRMLSYRKPLEWDSKWRIVMFDIPVDLKKARDSFAATLKRAGFKRLQKSVFISPYTCEEELEALSVQMGIPNYVDLIVADRISREQEYKKLFDLSSK